MMAEKSCIVFPFTLREHLATLGRFGKHLC
jgi:hypothetical protein